MNGKCAWILPEYLIRIFSPVGQICVLGPHRTLAWGQLLAGGPEIGCAASLTLGLCFHYHILLTGLLSLFESVNRLLILCAFYVPGTFLGTLYY